jgi:hypothetical protein
MTAIETLKNMMEDGTITEYDIPVGCLRNEARAKKALANLQKKEDPAMVAWQEYKKVMVSIRHYQNLLAEEGEASMHDLGELLTYTSMSESETLAICEKIAELQGRADELLPLAREWGRFTRDPEFGGAFAH